MYISKKEADNSGYCSGNYCGNGSCRWMRWKCQFFKNRNLWAERAEGSVKKTGVEWTERGLRGFFFPTKSLCVTYQCYRGELLHHQWRQKLGSLQWQHPISCRPIQPWHAYHCKGGEKNKKELEKSLEDGSNFSDTQLFKTPNAYFTMNAIHPAP